jgi:hypothetical protein
VSAAATELTVARLIREEGVRILPYDDATAEPVKAPRGNLTWGVGFNLMKCGSKGLFEAMLRYLVGVLEEDLVQLPWYLNLPDSVQSVCQDIGFNGGISDLLGYHKMIAAFEAGDFNAAADQCTEKDPKIDASRYAPLRAIIRAAAA